MISEKAVNKSVDNGFSRNEHFNAVQNIENLYQRATLKETHSDKKSSNSSVLLHRYTTNLNNASVLITLKETIEGIYKGNKIYTLELEALELKPSAPEPQGS